VLACATNSPAPRAFIYQTLVASAHDGSVLATPLPLRHLDTATPPRPVDLIAARHKRVNVHRTGCCAATRAAISADWSPGASSSSRADAAEIAAYLQAAFLSRESRDARRARKSHYGQLNYRAAVALYVALYVARARVPSCAGG